MAQWQMNCITSFFRNFSRFRWFCPVPARSPRDFAQVWNFVAALCLWTSAALNSSLPAFQLPQASPLHPLHLSPNKIQEMYAWRAGLRARVASPLFRRKFSDVAQAHALDISPTCITRLKQLQQQRQKNIALRVTVDGGGCSGFQYAFDIENWDMPPDQHSLKNESDILFKKDGVAVIVDNLSLAYIAGSKVDYIEEMISSSFRVTDNPNSETSCGCGVSFSPKL